MTALIHAQTREQQALAALFRFGEPHDLRHKLWQGTKGAPMLTVGTEVVVFPNSAEENLARDSIG